MTDYLLKHGECIETMKRMIKEGIKVHSVITDPPYHLQSIVSRFGKEGSAPTVDTGVFRRSSTRFMGKQWDGGDIAFNKEVWELCHELLVPGGYCLSFAATRNYHRMACAIEDAGFEIRDQIGWLYGCLSEDTKIITPCGPMTYDTIKTGDLVLCFDKYTKEYSYQPIEEIYEYQIDDTAYRIQSDYTDQIVSRNHRVLIEREGEYVFCFAENTQKQEIVPYVENVSELCKTISLYNTETNFKSENLWPNLQKSNNWNKEFTKNKTKNTNYFGLMFDLWKKGRKKQKEIFEIYRKRWNFALFETMQRITSWTRMAKICSFGTFVLDRSIQTKSDPTNDGVDKSCLERWDYEETKVWKLQRRNISSLSSRIQGHETEKRIYLSTSSIGGSTSSENINKDRSGSSYRPQSTQQSIRKFDVVCQQSRSQTIRSWKGHKTTLATITPINYKGVIWCVKVPIGCFVAERNGKYFVTGNSGFPKSHKVGGGWGSALKPAWEPICVARKSLIGTLQKNHDEYGTGSFHIEECRVEGGRFPANVIHDGVFDKPYFYCAKPSKEEKSFTTHPTVKPVALLRYLVRLVTPREGIVFDPFTGSGSTLEAAYLEGRDSIGIERETEYVSDIHKRMAKYNDNLF